MMRQAIGGFLVGMTLLVLPQQGHALSFTVSSAVVDVGDVFSINIGVVDAIDLTSWQFDLTFNPSLLQANQVTEGPFLSAFGTTSFTPPSSLTTRSASSAGPTRERRTRHDRIYDVVSRHVAAHGVKRLFKLSG